MQTTINLSNACVFDIEGNGFYDDITKVHCIKIKDINTKEMFGYRPSEIELGVKKLNEYDVWVAHNGIDYDIPCLLKLGWIKESREVLDTLILSRLIFPDRPGGHSLRAWGKRLGLSKGVLIEEDEDEPEKIWEVFTEEMFEYCDNDVELTYLLLNHLTKEIVKW